MHSHGPRKRGQYTCQTSCPAAANEPCNPPHDQRQTQHTHTRTAPTHYIAHAHTCAATLSTVLAA